MAEIEKRRNWVATMVLCWFLGLWGAHRFYTGKTTSAWVMVVLTILGITAPITAVWSLIDGFTIALGKFTDVQGRELEERIPWLGYTYMVLMILTIIGSVMYFSALSLILASILQGAGSVPPVTP